MRDLFCSWAPRSFDINCGIDLSSMQSGLSHELNMHDFATFQITLQHSLEMAGRMAQKNQFQT